MNLSKATRIGIKQVTPLHFPMSPLHSPRRQPQAHSRSYSEEMETRKIGRTWRDLHLTGSKNMFSTSVCVYSWASYLISRHTTNQMCGQFVLAWQRKRANACLKYGKRNFLMGIHRHSQKQCHWFPQGIKICSFSGHLNLVAFSDMRTSWQGG